MGEITWQEAIETLRSLVSLKHPPLELRLKAQAAVELLARLASRPSSGEDSARDSERLNAPGHIIAEAYKIYTSRLNITFREAIDAARAAEGSANG